MKRAVLYIRTSKTTQCPENQLPQLEQFCKDKGLTIVRVYAEQESAWVKGHQHEWKLLMTAALTGTLTSWLSGVLTECAARESVKFLPVLKL